MGLNLLVPLDNMTLEASREGYINRFRNLSKHDLVLSSDL